MRETGTTLSKFSVEFLFVFSISKLSCSPGIFNNSDSGGECAIPHYARFVMPRYGDDKPWFGFDYGQVHFVVMSTEHDFYRGTEQYHWIKYHLAQVDRSVTPWLIFAGHR